MALLRVPDLIASNSLPRPSHIIRKGSRSRLIKTSARTIRSLFGWSRFKYRGAERAYARDSTTALHIERIFGTVNSHSLVQYCELYFKLPITRGAYLIDATVFWIPFFSPLQRTWESNTFFAPMV